MKKSSTNDISLMQAAADRAAGLPEVDSTLIMTRAGAISVPGAMGAPM
jgi:hypothetical protein